MVVTGIGNNYNNVYESTYAAQKNETEYGIFCYRNRNDQCRENEEEHGRTLRETKKDT